MLSYQHIYHAGNPADVHKHALLCYMLEYLVIKDKPLTYIETHAGRGLYDLGAAEALKTGEAAQGIGRMARLFPLDHPYARRLAEVRARYGPAAYPGSPLLAALGLRDGDRIHLAELHPRENSALQQALAPWQVHVAAEDGFAFARSLCPPTPRRGLILIDPSYEVKTDYAAIPTHMVGLHRKWGTGIQVLWFPILSAAPHLAMLDALEAAFPQAWRHEVRFPTVRAGHRMEGSGLFVVNPPFGLADEAARLDLIFRNLM